MLLPMDDEDRPRPLGDAASRLAAEDLGPYSRAELDHRITLLEEEIARVRTHRDKVADHMAAANALFGKSGS